jgi:sec-independent protein translocase protein TatA
MGSLGFPEFLIIGGIVVVVFIVLGPKNLPKLGKMFGSTMKEVRKGMSDFSDEMRSEDEAPAANEPEEGRKVAKVIYEDEAEQTTIDPERKVAKVIYEDEV